MTYQHPGIHFKILTKFDSSDQTRENQRGRAYDTYWGEMLICFWLGKRERDRTWAKIRENFKN